MRISEQDLFQKYITFDKPVPYKEWLISSIKLCDIYEVQDILGILQIDKNTLGQIEFISMSYLRFVLIVLLDSELFQKQLVYLLQKSLDIPDDKIIQFFIDDKEEYLMIGKKIKEVHGHDIIDSNTAIKITSADFDEIKRIILYQNVLDYTDRYIDPDVKKDVDEYWRLKNKGAAKVTLEHKINCVQLKTGMTRKQIGDLSIRNFSLLFDAMVDESDYVAAKTAEFNGVKFKSPIEHWALKARKDKYADAFVDADAFVKKIQSV